MKDKSKIRGRIQAISHLNIIQSVRLNFHFFPFSTAIKFPILLFGKVDIGDCICEKVNRSSSKEKKSGILLEKVQTGILRFGLKDCWANGAACDKKSYFKVKGKLVLGDSVIVIGNGCRFVVEERGSSKIMGGVIMNYNGRIYCEEEIQIGRNTKFSWDCQVYDTNFHYVVGPDGRVKKLTKRICIGDNCWIGNRVTISKGSTLPNNSIVASHSLVNKSFLSEESKGCVVGGIPAIKLRDGFSRVFENELINKLDDYFMTHSECNDVCISDLQ